METERAPLSAASDMKVTLKASTAAKIVVWLQDDLYHARHADSADKPEVCVADDLFEVIAELSDLSLEQGAQAAEAMALADAAQRQLDERSVPKDALSGEDRDADEDRSICREA